MSRKIGFTITTLIVCIAPIPVAAPSLLSAGMIAIEKVK